MGQRKVKLLAMLVVALCANSITYTAHAEEIQDAKPAITDKSSAEMKNDSVINYQESKVNEAMQTKDSDVEIKDNWLTEEVAKQLNKKVKDLTVDDFNKITKIDLHYKRIEEKFPEEISLLNNLEYLNLNYCRLKDKIPDEIADLPKLTYLDLGDNKLDKIGDKLLNNIKLGKYTYCDILGNQFKIYDDWYCIKGKWYYFDHWGYKATGSQKINGKEYEFTDDGYVREGWEDNSDGTKSYYDKDNGKIKSSWKAVGYDWYYFNEEGIMQTGFQTINGKKYYLGTDGVMRTGIQNIDGKQLCFSKSGDMQFGWTTFNGKKYYCDPSTGELITNQQKVIDGKTYKFLSDGSLMTSGWVDGNTYIDQSGQTVSSSSTHSNTQFNLYKYMTDTNNRVSVHYRAIELHGGDTSNNCVFFTSEALRRVGIDLPLGTCNTYDLEDKLQAMGFVQSYDLSQLKPGDIVFTNGYTHVYIFMGWASNGYAYICDNQADRFDNKVLHLRSVYSDTAITDRATHFFYYPY
ncbi:MAG: cell wall-binding protein [Clostridium sp.]|nr:cell wall-binding protein [Clostridium sp.]